MFNSKNKVKVNRDSSKIITISHPKSYISEQYRAIRTNIQYASQSGNLKTLVLTSATSGEGKTTTSTNLAAVFALAGLKVLLVDADMRTSSLTKMLNGNRFLGLSTLLSGNASRYHEYVQPLKIENFYFLSSGPTPPNPSEILASQGMDELLSLLTQEYDLVVFDMPPVIPVTDAQVVSVKADGTILVVREGYSNKKLIYQAKQSLDAVKANLLGVVYNGAKTDANNSYYYYSDNHL